MQNEWEARRCRNIFFTNITNTQFCTHCKQHERQLSASSHFNLYYTYLKLLFMATKTVLVLQWKGLIQFIELYFNIGFYCLQFWFELHCNIWPFEFRRTHTHKTNFITHERMAVRIAISWFINANWNLLKSRAFIQSN